MRRAVLALALLAAPAAAQDLVAVEACEGRALLHEFRVSTDQVGLAEQLTQYRFTIRNRSDSPLRATARWASPRPGLPAGNVEVPAIPPGAPAEIGMGTEAQPLGSDPLIPADVARAVVVTCASG
jgi:hypothetical protein